MLTDSWSTLHTLHFPVQPVSQEECLLWEGILPSLWIHPAGTHSYHNTLVVLKTIQKQHMGGNQDNSETDFGLLEKRVAVRGQHNPCSNPKPSLQGTEQSKQVWALGWEQKGAKSHRCFF